MKNNGTLYLIPTTLGDIQPDLVLPVTVKSIIEKLDHFIVENNKTARRFIKNICPEKVQSELILYTLDKRTTEQESNSFLDICEQGTSIGLISEAGVPGIADPGANVVLLAHRKGIKVVPLVGPSSVILAMMSSGLNGQNFAFNGYLPVDKSEKKFAIKDFERLSKAKNQSQIFIETPYRNNGLFDDLKQSLHPETYLCIAADITLGTEFIKTLKVKDWKSVPIDLHKRPAIFIFHQM
ncbi:SAM-dependent methyltransferase [Namhaeicola litoreus]|uniref:SAM-dependent methyltransferase n=1 Tax=Namhaeicola litoreus TaxID=1052145 RepID=A0ABW3Y4F0_9FLAO